MKENIFIGVAWPYVNGDLHIGHLAGYLLPADIFARYNRMVGNNVLMASGSDCYGTPITIEADKRNIPPHIVADEYHLRHEKLFKDILHLTYDIYTKTSTEHHAEVVQDFFIKLLEREYIYIDTSMQYYSDYENKFLPDRYVVGKCPLCGFKDARSDQCDYCGAILNQGELIDPKSTLSKSAVILKETQHYFLDWSKLQSGVEIYIQSHKHLWKEWVSSEALGWLQEGLKPRAITRDIDWGVRIPVDRMPKDKIIENIESKRIYVWFDAVIGYYSASLLLAKNSGKDINIFWRNPDAKHYYFMGKDNLVFHSIFWPGQLMGYDKDLHLPDVCSTNMFLDLEGKKFSKSRGITIGIKDFVEKFGNDRTRFYLTYIMPETRDTSFSWSGFRDTVNGVLVANLGNYINRVLAIGFKNNVKMPFSPVIDTQLVDMTSRLFEKAKEDLCNCRFREYLDTILKLSSTGNKICDTKKVWALCSEDPTEFNKVTVDLYFIVACLAYLIQPIMPEASGKLFETLYTDKDKNNIRWPEKIDEEFINKIMKIDIVDKPLPIFSKIEPSEQI